MRAWDTDDSAGFRGPLDVTRAATAVLDGDGVVLGWSRAAETLLGYRPPDILGRRVDSLLVERPAPGPFPPKVPYEEARTLPGEEAGSGQRRRAVRSGPLKVRHHDGRTVEVAAAMCAISADGPGRPAWVMVATELEEVRGWDAHQAMLRGLTTQSPIGLAIYDTSLRLAWANVAAQREIGRPVGEHIGTPVDELYPQGEVVSEEYPRELGEVVRQVLETGEPVVDLHYRARVPASPDGARVWSCSYYRLLDSRGHPLGVCEDAFDITDRYRAQQRLGLMVRAGASIGTTLDVPATAWEVAEVTVPQFADAVSVDLLAAVLEGEEPGAEAAASTRPLVRVAHHARGEGEERPGGRAAFEGGPVDYAPGSAQARALALGRAVLVDASDAPDPSLAAGSHSSLVVPLRARGTVMGLVTFHRGHNPARFDPDELSLADELVARTAVCVDNARRYTRERAAALALQRNLLPQHLPPQSAVDVSYRYLPADTEVGVGGDWFDVIALSGTRVGLVVGDVVGHGLRAAATMGRLRTTVRALARLDLAPDELLARLDDLIQQGAEERAGAARDGEDGPVEADYQVDEAVGASCLYAVYDPISARCSLARAGHPPPAVVCPDGSPSVPDIPSGPALGVGGLPFESTDIELPAGSLLALYTDGLVEMRDGDGARGLERLTRVLGDHDRPLEELCDRATAELLPEGATTDDAAMLLVRTRVLGEGQVGVWELPADPAAVSHSRWLAAAQLDVWGLEELTFATELVVSELVTNAIRYASGGPVQLRLIRDRTLLCEVSDTGHTSPHLRHAESDDEGGRGLFIVAQVVQRWGTRYTPTGKTIWTEQLLPS
ncbi:SpoIIE family protein phosphatase [Streptomyces sp. URMC 123]|uniref:SpoIIE family protein phosphatase n=1 Tax=Streptomyces sp. URMC 123 TaxID=3423403 RepID=UPI003F1C1E45